jgi:Zn-finger nucleic acid-binding protein
MTKITYHTEEGELQKLISPCRCAACENPCRYGSGAMTDADVKRLAKHLGKKEDEVKEEFLDEITKFNTTLHRPKLERKNDLPYGKCIFFDEKEGCKVHEAKPTECRIAMGCKEYGEDLITWFNLRNYLDPKDDESVRQYRSYVESGGKVLEGAQLDKIASQERLAQLDAYKDLERSRKKDWDSILGIKEDQKNGEQAKDVHKR